MMIFFPFLLVGSMVTLEQPAQKPSPCAVSPLVRDSAADDPGADSGSAR